MIRAIIIEDQPDLAAALRETVEFDGAVDVIAVCHTLGMGAEVIGRLRPDIVVTDFRLPDGDAVDEFPRWRAVAPNCRILVVSAWTDERSIRRARDAGAQGYLEKGPDLDVLPEAIESIAAGGSRWLDEVVDERVWAPDDLDLVALEVLAALRAGLATSEIASRCVLSEFVVRQHVNHLLRAYGVNTRRELIEVSGKQR